MVRKLLVGSLVLLGALGFSGVASADHDGLFHIYPVASSGSVTPQTVFQINDTPFIYLHLPFSGFNAVAAFWESPSGPSFLTADFSSATEYWFSPDDGTDAAHNPVSWNSVKEPGHWDVRSGYAYLDGTVGGGSTGFTVTPEPLAALLFPFGGLVLAGLTRRRNQEAL